MILDKEKTAAFNIQEDLINYASRISSPFACKYFQSVIVI